MSLPAYLFLYDENGMQVTGIVWHQAERVP